MSYKTYAVSSQAERKLKNKARAITSKAKNEVRKAEKLAPEKAVEEFNKLRQKRIEEKMKRRARPLTPQQEQAVGQAIAQLLPSNAELQRQMIERNMVQPPVASPRSRLVENYRKKRQALTRRLKARPTMSPVTTELQPTVPEKIPEPEELIVEEVPRKSPVQQFIEKRRRLLRRQPVEEEIIPAPEQTPQQFMQQQEEKIRRPTPLMYVERHREFVREPFFFPVIKPEERSTIFRRAFQRRNKLFTDVDYAPVLMTKRRFVFNRRYAPFTDEEFDDTRFTDTEDVYEPQRTVQTQVQTTQNVTIAPDDNIPIFPMPSSPSAFFYNNSPSSDVEISPHTRMVVKTKSRPVISVSSIAPAYLTQLIQPRPRISVSTNVNTYFKRLLKQSNYY